MYCSKLEHLSIEEYVTIQLNFLPKGKTLHLRIREEITKKNNKRWTINFMATLQQMKMKRRVLNSPPPTPFL
jgi:hypothetical protein